ncbi:HPP family-domain-containing protein [Apiosordaria backusii]|uniref:HPP family-domain-containing protein n=1 Tax=Apiosordaria backusii TaxID=314023 RepID=A0AA40EFH5_9PEZI|nr:HPP family-domain-containing protein [Apiosordaria backusii]
MSFSRSISNTHVTRKSSHSPTPDKRKPSWSTLHFDIDAHLNLFFPSSFLPRFPHAVAHFLGKFRRLRRRGCRLLLGVLYGAAAVLDFYAIESPLAQPRNAILGQIVASVTGIIVCKLFALLGPEEFERVRWLGGSLACGLSTAVMALTGTVHPPAGATALMAVVDEDISNLGWYVLVPVSLGCGLMLVVALLVNNIQRRFPYYWWSPSETGLGTDSETGAGEEADHEVVIRRGEVIIPEGITLRPEEVLWLETISQRLYDN